MAVAATPLRGGLIGCGYFSRFHLEAWARLPGVTINAACDPDLSRAQAAAPRAYASAAAMLGAEELDFVDIATCPESHAELVELAAASGLAVVCQKPLSPDWAGVLRIRDAVRLSGIPFMVHENWRWQAWYREAARLIAAGAIGQPITYCFRARTDDGAGAEPYPRQPYFREMPRLFIFEFLVHHIDTARFLFGPIQQVFARTARLNSSVCGEDRALILLAHERAVDGVVDGHGLLSTGDPAQTIGDAWFEGDRGRLIIDGFGDLRLNEEIVWRNPRMGYRGDSVFACLNHFIACLRSGKEFETGVEQYLPTVAAMEAAYLSAASGRAVRPEEIG